MASAFRRKIDVSFLAHFCKSSVTPKHISGFTEECEILTGTLSPSMHPKASYGLHHAGPVESHNLDWFGLPFDSESSTWLLIVVTKLTRASP